MRYIMKQKLFSWGDDFVIRDEEGADAFFVDGKVFSLGDQLSFKDMAGNELAFVKQRVLSWGPSFEIYKAGQLYAVVKKELFTFFNCRFTVDVPGPDDLQAEGDLLDHEYTFNRGGETVAEVSKQWFTWSNTYGVDVGQGEDDILILASSVVIDMACHEDKE